LCVWLTNKNSLLLNLRHRYTGIVNGLADGGAAPILLQVEVDRGVHAVAGMAAFFGKLVTCAPEDEVVKGAVGLIGDLAKNLGKPSASFLGTPSTTQLLALCDEIDDDETGEKDEKAVEVSGFAKAALAAACQ